MAPIAIGADYIGAIQHPQPQIACEMIPQKGREHYVIPMPVPR
jgi:hypothetical protein